MILPVGGSGVFGARARVFKIRFCLPRGPWPQMADALDDGHTLGFESALWVSRCRLVGFRSFLALNGDAFLRLLGEDS